MTESTERVSWRRLVAEIILADHLPMPRHLDRIKSERPSGDHVSLSVANATEAGVWIDHLGGTVTEIPFTDRHGAGVQKCGSGMWHGWSISVTGVSRHSESDPLDDATKAALAAVE